MIGHLLIRSFVGGGMVGGGGVTEIVVSPVFADSFCQLILRLFIAIILP